MTKPLTSVAAMQLIEEGRLMLDDLAEEYLPELRELSVFETFDSHTKAYTVRPPTQTLTVRHLLTNTSGLGYFWLENSLMSSIIRDFKPRPAEHYSAGPLLFGPGEQWLYGTSTDWVGRLIESVSGVTVDDYFRDHILQPLHMTDTFYYVPEAKRRRVVATHQRQPDGSITTNHLDQPATAVTRFGGGGLFSTAHDYITFMQMLLNGGTLKETRILSTEGVASIGANQIGSLPVRALKTARPEISSDFSFIADGRDKWGFGFLIAGESQSGKRSAGSLSWGGIENTYFWIDPSTGIGGVIMMQFRPFADSKALAVYDAFERAVYQLSSSH